MHTQIIGLTEHSEANSFDLWAQDLSYVAKTAHALPPGISPQVTVNTYSDAALSFGMNFKLFVA